MSARRWIRWSLRDLRHRWGVVVATGLVLAIGAGLFTTFGAMREWRTASADASAEVTATHDVRVTLDDGTDVRAGRLAAAVRAAVPGAVPAERLNVPVTVSLPAASASPPVAGRVVGTAPGGPAIDRLAVEAGRDLRAGEDGAPSAVVEENAARAHDLQPGATVRAGGRDLRLVGRAWHPEWFVVSRDEAVWGAELRYVVLFTGLRTAQELAGRPGRVDEAVVRLPAGVDGAAATAALERALPGALGGLPVTVTARDDEPARRFLQRDAENDQRVFTVFAVLILAGAALGTYNLVTRVIDAQRREIGIGMALGTPPRLLALRPLLLGAQIAAVGVLAGVGLAVGTAELFKPLLEDLLPMPEVRTPFAPFSYAIGAGLAASIPLVAAAVAVRRVVRLTPLEAIRSGFRAAGSTGLVGAVRRVPLPGGSLGRLPVRNVLRAPRRTALTVVALSAVVGVAVALGGMIDAYDDAVDRAANDVAGATPDRVSILLREPVRADGPEIARLAGLPAVGAAEPWLELPAQIGSERLQLTFVPDRSRLWAPTVQEGGPPGPDGVLLSRRAADALGVAAGDRVVLRHARPGPDGRLVAASTPVRVAGTHPNPFRATAVADTRLAARLGLGGLSNLVAAVPAGGRTPDDVVRAVVDVPGVAAAEPAGAASAGLREVLDDFGGVLAVGWVFALALALLLAFNATSIGLEERRREHATLFAHGVRPRTVVGLVLVEHALVGVLAAAGGLLIGRLVAGWVTGSLLADTQPDLGLDVVISAQTAWTAAGLTLLALLAGPLLQYRRLRRLDLPATLRVVE